MTRNTRLTLAAVVALILVMVGVLAMNRRDAIPSAKTTGGAVEPAVLVREDSHRLTSAPDGRVTLVEFLDFECGPCAAAYPTVKEILADYEGQITFVVRYFPISSHPNAELAARAAESAANQDRFAEMYQLLFENQNAWSRQDEPQTEVFLGYARTLGLDIDRFQRDLDDPATAARVAKDRTDGEAVGVQGTPTFFLNGEPLSDLRKDDLTTMIDAALAG
ncbi:DsbA family protein [Salinispora tropica]|uniref:DSBA oxidoreductase n=1 Tax=Salinispora tropica (strain ATCC BAA-916 / DSM 44818 / JCM 13857 / NBRC 105044 / CNB-440) TaxID=369723 RepID=A4X1A8_SALTO|nr:DsbA family protein [Salinispora tropica]ABP52658.1 DSBA oxidoreductase [Salinispora tropica CNB-440]